MDCKHKRRYRT